MSSHLGSRLIFSSVGWVIPCSFLLSDDIGVLWSWPVCWVFSSVQSLSRVWLFATPWIAAHQASLSITNSRVHSNSCPSSRWCHPAISSSVVPFSCPQSLPVSGSFPMSLLLWVYPFILSGVISPLISSSILGTYWPWEFFFQYPIILPFHTVHGVLKARILSGLPFRSPVDPIKLMYFNCMRYNGNSSLGNCSWHLKRYPLILQ